MCSRDDAPPYEAEHGILGLSTPWARGRIREPLRSELAELIPVGYMVGVSVDANNAQTTAWVNTTGASRAHIDHGYDAETVVRSCIAWAIRDAEPVRVTVTTRDGWIESISEGE